MNTESKVNSAISEAPSGIHFNNVFRLEDIQHMQDLFSDAHGVASIIIYPDGIPITNPSNFTRFCSEIIRKTEKGCAMCLRSDALTGSSSLSGPVISPGFTATYGTLLDIEGSANKIIDE